MPRKATKAASTSAAKSIATPREPTVKTVKSKKAAPATEPVVITDEMIRARAHQLWLDGVPGSALDHWCQAERELRAGK